MTAFAKLTSALSALLLLTVPKISAAQDAPAGAPAGDQAVPAASAPVAPAPVASAPAAPAPAAPAPGAMDNTQLQINQDQQVPPEKMVNHAKKSLQEMRSALARAMKVLTKARESKDVIRLNCVNEKLTPMKGILKIAEDALIGLQENIATGNVEAASYEFSKIRISHEKVSNLLVQANNCIGAEASYTGETEIDVNVDPDVTGTDDPYYGDPQILVNPADNTVNPNPDGANPVEQNPVDVPPIASPFR